MKRELEKHELVERSIIKKYRKELWGPFITALKRYELVQREDKIAVYVSGGKASVLLAKLMQMLHRVSDVPLEPVFLAAEPGDTAELLHIPAEVLETDVFQRAQELGCNKIALGHHLNDVVEATLMGMLYGGRLQGMIPKLPSESFPGLELIRPLYRIREADILAWARYNGLEFGQYDFSSDTACGAGDLKRQEVRELLRQLSKQDPDIEKRIFNSVHAVCLDTFPGYQLGREDHSFLEKYK